MSSMLPLPPFELHQPVSTAQATALLSDLEKPRIISGGTDLLPSMKYGLFTPPHLVSTRRIESFSAISGTEECLSIGAGATLSSVSAHPWVRRHYPTLATACSTVATPTIQEMGTLGGNVMLDTRCLWYNQSTFWRNALGGCLKCEGEICHVAPKGQGCYAVHSADTVVVLLLLNAELELASVRGTRRMPLESFYTDDGIHWASLEPGELLTRIVLPPPPRARLAFRKLRARGSIDYPLLLTAVRVDLDEHNQPSGGRVVLSALGPRPIEVSDVSESIAQSKHEEAAEIAWSQAFPLPTHQWSTPWRKKMVRVEVGRALAELS